MANNLGGRKEPPKALVLSKYGQLWRERWAHGQRMKEFKVDGQSSPKR